MVRDIPKSEVAAVVSWKHHETINREGSCQNWTVWYGDTAAVGFSASMAVLIVFTLGSGSFQVASWSDHLQQSKPATQSHACTRGQPLVSAKHRSVPVPTGRCLVQFLSIQADLTTCIW